MSKIVLVFVEGITDKISLELSLNTLESKSNKKSIFIVYGTDITQQDDVDSQNILSRLNKAISDGFSELRLKHKIKLSDINRIIHIVDTDGVFISPDKVIHFNGDDIEYTVNEIKTKNVDSIKKRNEKKSLVLNKLSNIDSITFKSKSLPYEIYFMSTNLDHVLHNVQNPTREQKDKLSKDWQLEMAPNYDKLIAFFDGSNDYISNMEYDESWEFIKQSSNSLMRFTNLDIYIKKIE